MTLMTGHLSVPGANFSNILQAAFAPVDLHSFFGLRQTCQTGGPRAACGPISCPMQPQALSFYPKLTAMAHL